MRRRRTARYIALLGALAALPACGLIADIQPLTVANQDVTDADAGLVVDADVPLEAAPDAPTCSVKTTPLRLPGTADQSGDPQTHLSWSGADAIKFDDDAGATVDGPFTYSFELLASGFKFDIPATATILGVTVEVRVRAQNKNAWVDQGLTLQPPGTDAKTLRQSPGYASPEYEIRTYGGPDELWGLLLDPSAVNQDAFGVGFQTYHGSPINGSASVDYIKMQIRYSSCE